MNTFIVQYTIMKKAKSAIITGLLFVNFTFAGNVPDAIKKAFALKFPDAVEVKWDKENAHEYEASFDLKGQKYSANFSDLGKWLETESPLTIEQLPEKV